MNIIANKSYLKLAMLFSLLLVSLYATSAYGLDKTSTATINKGSVTEGSNTNIWDGSAVMTITATNIGMDSWGLPSLTGKIKKSNFAIIPDTTAFSRTIYSSGSGSFNAAISTASSYYADASTASGATGKVVVESLDKSW